MIKIVYAMLAIAIEDLKVQLSNSNLLIKKNAICFKSLVYKEKISKHIANVLYYKY